jgi:hypothetical protein
VGTELDAIRTQTDELRQQNETFVNETLDLKIQMLREELSGRNEDNWAKSLKLAQETIANEKTPSAKNPEPANKLVAMNNKIYKMANEAGSEPKPRLQVKK